MSPAQGSAHTAAQTTDRTPPEVPELIFYRAYLGLGSNMSGNLGSPAEQLCRGVDVLTQHPQVELVEASGIYATAPWGVVDQAEFSNAVIAVETSLRPIELLHFAQFVEHLGARTREHRWGPRTIDIDLLGLYQAVPAAPTVSGQKSNDAADERGDASAVDYAPVESHGCWGMELVVPHPYAHERAFVLKPWSELPSAREPWCSLAGRSIADWLDELTANDAEEVAGVRRDQDLTASALNG